MLEALRRGLKDPNAGCASRAAIGYVQLVYGRQLQQRLGEQGLLIIGGFGLRAADTTVFARLLAMS